jgi:endonuclease YncB( thermonuclease family)
MLYYSYKDKTIITIMELLTNIKNDDIPLMSLNGTTAPGKVVEMYDGDTCKIVLLINGQLQKYNCRLLGLDTPEMKPPLTKPNRDVEIKMAHACRNKLMQLVTNCSCPNDAMLKKQECAKLLDSNTKIIRVECGEFDKYGRLLVTLFADEKCVNNILVEGNFAKSYDGGTKEGF